MKISIPAFENNGSIPKQYTADGKNFSPRVVISGVPENAQSLALIVDDPDAPGRTFVHWVVWNIPINIREIPEGYRGALQGRNDFQEPGWGGPSPPPGKTHHYSFRVYALDNILTLIPGSTKQQLETAMKGHIVAQSEWIGVYQR